MKKVLTDLNKELSEYDDFYEARQLLKQIDLANPDDISNGLQLAQSSERLLKILGSGAINNSNLLYNLRNTLDPLWSSEPEISIDDEKANRLAMQFYKSNQEDAGKTTTFRISHIGKKVVESIVEIFMREGKSIDSIEFDEPFFHADLLAGTGERGFDTIKQRRLQKWTPADKLITVRKNTPSEIRSMYDDKTKSLFDKLPRAGTDRVSTGELFYTLTVIPTPEDAAMDNMPYDKYLELFFESCDQPWEEIGKAQEIIIDQFDNAKELWIVNENGTDVRFNIDGMTFANSLVLKNIPGSEIFSAPRKDGVHGRIVAKGNHKYSGALMKDIVLDDIRDGKINNPYAVEGNQEFQKILKANPGTEYLGEIGIGTNPHLQQQFLNGLLLEKVGGSFHVALGEPYQYTTYNGKPVNLDNGNKCDIHRDITTMLRGMKSHMVLDGKIVQQDGKRLDPRLKVLNEGRGAIPTEKQPDRWKAKFPNGY